MHDIRNVFLWDSKKTLLIANVQNALDNQVAYSSFEDQTTDSWQMSAGGTYPGGGITGSRSFSGTLTKSVPSGNYTVTLWSTSAAPTVNGGSTTAIVTKGSWKLFRWRLNTVTSVTVAGSNIDEVRLHPTNAWMTTYTYKPFIGLETECDKNNDIKYYSYDGFNRLLRIKDLDQNILKEFSYKYQAPGPACVVTTANWVASNVKRCLKTANNNNTGVEEKEEEDRNYCSPTFLDKRWVSLGVTGACPVVSNCTAADKRVINGVCVTGMKMLDPATYDKTNGRWSCVYHYEWPDGARSQFYIEPMTGSGCVAD